MHPPRWQSEYEVEWQRRDQLQSAAAIPIGILTLLGSALVYLLKEFQRGSHVITWAFGLVWVVAALLYVVSVYMVFRSYVGYRYQRLALPSALERHRRELVAYHLGIGGSPDEADRDFAEYLSARYVEATDQNAVNNINRGEYLHKANKAAAFCLSAVLLAGVIHSAQLKTLPEKAYKVELVNK